MADQTNPGTIRECRKSIGGSKSNELHELQQTNGNCKHISIVKYIAQKEERIMDNISVCISVWEILQFRNPGIFSYLDQLTQ